MIFHVAEEIIFLWSAFSPFLFSTCKWCSKQQPCHISVTINPTDMADNAKSPSTQWGNMTSSKNAPPFHCHSHVSEFTRGYFHPWILLSHTKNSQTPEKTPNTHRAPETRLWFFDWRLLDADFREIFLFRGTQDGSMGFGDIYLWIKLKFHGIL